MVRENKKNNSISANHALIPEAAALTAVLDIQCRTAPITIQDLYKQIQSEERKIANGDLGQIEKFLHSQIIALNALFDNMLSRLAHAESISHAQLSATIGLKAQAQCRTTIATLVEIKNPAHTTFVQQRIQQQNNAINQQVNNSRSEAIPKAENLANELLEVTYDKRLDIRKTNQAIRINPQMESMAQINGAKDNEWESVFKPKCL